MKIQIWLLVLIFLVACGSEILEAPRVQPIFSYIETPSGLLFIQVQDPDFGIDEESKRGTLVREGNCLRIVNDDLGETATAIWVPTVKIEDSQGIIQLHDIRPTGTIQVGDKIRFAATRFFRAEYPEEWVSQIPDECGEPYYVLDGINLLE